MPSCDGLVVEVARVVMQGDSLMKPKIRAGRDVAPAG